MWHCVYLSPLLTRPTRVICEAKSLCCQLKHIPSRTDSTCPLSDSTTSSSHLCLLWRSNQISKGFPSPSSPASWSEEHRLKYVLMKRNLERSCWRISFWNSYSSKDNKKERVNSARQLNSPHKQENCSMPTRSTRPSLSCQVKSISPKCREDSNHKEMVSSLILSYESSCLIWEKRT